MAFVSALFTPATSSTCSISSRLGHHRGAVLATASLRGQVRHKVSAGGGWEFYGGRTETKSNYKLNEVPKEVQEQGGLKTLGFTKWPTAVKSLGSEYFFRPNQGDPLTYYHVRPGEAMKKKAYDPEAGVYCDEFVYLGSTNAASRNTKSIENALTQETTGYAVQLILEGRGVKAYFEPKFPFLMARLGVGSKVTNLTEYARRDPGIDITVNKLGTLITIEGPTKERVGVLAFRIFSKLKSNPYTGKGAHIAFNPAKRKAVRKK